MGQVYEFLGMKVGLLQNGMDPEEKIPQYQADVPMVQTQSSVSIICATTWSHALIVVFNAAISFAIVE